MYFLFPTSVGRSRKTGLIGEIASWRSVEINDKAPLFDAFDTGIGDPGFVYNAGRPNELTYLARSAIAVIDKPEPERVVLLHDHLRTRALLDDLAETHREEFERPPQLRHVVLFLLFPEEYERIASEGHKARICGAFSEIIEGETPDDLLMRVDSAQSIRSTFQIAIFFRLRIGFQSSRITKEKRLRP